MLNGTTVPIDGLLQNDRVAALEVNPFGHDATFHVFLIVGRRRLHASNAKATLGDFAILRHQTVRITTRTLPRSGQLKLKVGGYSRVVRFRKKAGHDAVKKNCERGAVAFYLFLWQQLNRYAAQGTGTGTSNAAGGSIS